MTPRWLALAVTAVFATACSGSDVTDDGISRHGSTEASGRAVALRSPPSSFTVTYRVEERSGDDVRTTTAVLLVDRPFGSRFTTLEGPPPGSEVLTERVTTFGVFAQRSGTGAPFALTAAPALAAGDVRPDVLVPAPLAEEAAERRERREVIGRPCQVHRLGRSITSGEVAPGVRAQVAIQ